MRLLVAYDISDPRRLTRVAKIMLDYGERVQKSIFEISVNGQTFREMRQRVDAEIDMLLDSVKYYPLCSKCATLISVIGIGSLTELDREYDVL